MTANPKKCTLRKSKTKYLGFPVGQEAIQPLADKVAVVREFHPPQTKGQIKSFLGLTSYYRCFIPHFTELATPLMDAIKGRVQGLI